MKGKRIVLLLASSLLSVVILEWGLRFHEPPKRENAVAAGFFTARSAELGWDGRPDTEGYFANGHCYGHVVTDRFGNRLNSPVSTFEPSHRNILMIGDSNTVSLEVDNDETVAALLETRLREEGMNVNVVNLGVRGYGTDQSVRKALLHARRAPPEQIVYLFTDNDFFDNNVVRLPTWHYGKGVYLRRLPDGFEPHDYPVPLYDRGFWGAVVLDEDGEPFLHTGVAPRDAAFATLPASRRGELGAERAETLVIHRRLLDAKRRFFPDSPVERKLRYWEHRRADPGSLAQSADRDHLDVLAALFFASIDGGVGRAEHRGYYEAQFRYLLGRLREIPSLRRVHLVEFPSVTTLDLMKKDQPSTNRRLFESLLSEGLVDRYVNLNQTLVDDHLGLREMECRSGDHFSATGNRWVAETILDRIRFDD